MKTIYQSNISSKYERVLMKFICPNKSRTACFLHRQMSFIKVLLYLLFELLIIRTENWWRSRFFVLGIYLILVHVRQKKKKKNAEILS
jgi:hypothetical protein